MCKTKPSSSLLHQLLTLLVLSLCCSCRTRTLIHFTHVRDAYWDSVWVSCFFVLLTTSVSVILCWSVNVNMFLTHVESYVVSALCLHLTRLVVFVGDFFYTIIHRLCNWIMLWAIALSTYVCVYVGYVWVWYVHSGMSYLVAIHGIASMWGPKFHLSLQKDVMCVDCCLLL